LLIWSTAELAVARAPDVLPEAVAGVLDVFLEAA
jgi:hypothetical protein